jgi:uncharacterized delta-60 repeat protein
MSLYSKWGVALTVVVLSGVWAMPARAAVGVPGELDPEFGEGGKVLTEFGSFADGARALTLQPNGQIVAAGRSDANGNPGFALARYNGDGSPDAAFGRGGKVLTDFGDAAWATALAVQPNGQIVAAGGAYANGRAQFALARYNADGSLDSSFGAGGRVLTVIRDTAGASAVAVQPDGRIVVAGWSHGDVDDMTEFVLARYNGDGSRDSSFGRGGTVLIRFGENAAARTMAVQPDGRILVVGEAVVDGATEFALARCNPNGSPDSSFGKAGKVLTGFGDAAWAAAATVAPDGQIVVAGYSYANSRARLALARYNGNGAPDSSFGKEGKVLTDPGDVAGTVAYALAVQPDGRIVVAGQTIANRTAQFALVRHNGDGTLDASFGTGGEALAHFGDAAGASAVAVQPDGQVIAAGWSNANGRGYFALARFQGR